MRPFCESNVPNYCIEWEESSPVGPPRETTALYHISNAFSLQINFVSIAKRWKRHYLDDIEWYEVDETNKRGIGLRLWQINIHILRVSSWSATRPDHMSSADPPRTVKTHPVTWREINNSLRILWCSACHFHHSISISFPIADIVWKFNIHLSNMKGLG